MVDGVKISDPANMLLLPSEGLKASLVEMRNDGTLYTVRDIPHWLNPTRVQVSDWEENDLTDHLHALALSWSLSIRESI